MIAFLLRANEEPTHLVHYLYQVPPLNLKRTFNTIYLLCSKNRQLKDRRFPIICTLIKWWNWPSSRQEIYDSLPPDNYHKLKWSTLEFIPFFSFSFKFFLIHFLCAIFFYTTPIKIIQIRKENFWFSEKIIILY